MQARPVIVTRPAHEAQHWVEALQAAGIEAQAFPLIAIAPAPDPQALQQMHARLQDFDALMFVSPAAVHHFFADAGAPALAAAIRQLPGLRCWAPGPGTVRALQAVGVPLAGIDAPAHDAEQFDSESLWAQVQDQVQPGQRVLMVRGGDASGRAAGRQWLAERIQEAGGTLETLVAYRRLAPPFDAQAAQQVALALQQDAIWLFSSSEAIANLLQAWPQADWQCARALATHPRIAQRAQAAGFRQVRSTQPALAALIASIESFE